MREPAETVHVAFGRSIADTLRDVMAAQGIAERVVGVPDPLHVGPIDPPDLFLRQAWGESVLSADAKLRGVLVDDPAGVEDAWAQATAPGIAAVFWVCLDSPAEHACFLAFAARMEGRLYEIVDATGLRFQTADGVEALHSLGSMRAEDIVASKLYATRRLVLSERHRAASEAWSRLQHENGGERRVGGSRPVDRPRDHDVASHATGGGNERRRPVRTHPRPWRGRPARDRGPRTRHA